MQERKVLTLTECLELKRQPTLQEMVDLSERDYAKYLYCQGIIKYIPERLEDYVPVDEYDGYYPCIDMVLNLKKPNYEEILEELNYEDDEDDYELMNESDENYNRLYALWKVCEEFYGIVETNGRIYKYHLTDYGFIRIYENDNYLNDNDDNIDVGRASYLLTDYAEYIKEYVNI